MAWETIPRLRRSPRERITLTIIVFYKISTVVYWLELVVSCKSKVAVFWDIFLYLFDSSDGNTTEKIRYMSHTERTNLVSFEMPWAGCQTHSVHARRRNLCTKTFTKGSKQDEIFLKFNFLKTLQKWIYDSLAHDKNLFSGYYTF